MGCYFREMRRGMALEECRLDSKGDSDTCEWEWEARCMRVWGRVGLWRLEWCLRGS